VLRAPLSRAATRTATIYALVAQAPLSGLIRHQTFVKRKVASERKASSTAEGTFDGPDRSTAKSSGPAPASTSLFGSNSQLRALAEVHASADAKASFVKDFVPTWT
jgi:catalase (peroxidase I)